MSENVRGREYRALKREIMGAMHCAMPGEVVSFDSDSQTAVIQLTIRTKSGIVLPQLKNVPVFMPVQFDINAGDACLVIFSDVCVDSWLRNGGINDPDSGRMHSFSDGFAFVGFKVP